MIIYRKQLNKEEESLKRIFGVCKVKKTKADLEKDYKEYLSSFLNKEDLGNLFCYEIPSNKPEYLYSVSTNDYLTKFIEGYPLEVSSTIDGKSDNSKDKIELLIENVSQYDLFLIEQLLYKKNLKEKTHYINKTDNGYLITSEIPSREIFLFNHIHKGKLKLPSSSLIVSFLKKEVENDYKDKKLLELLKSELSFIPSSLDSKQLIYILPSLSKKLPFLGYELCSETPLDLSKLPTNSGYYTYRKVSIDKEEAILRINYKTTDYYEISNFKEILMEVKGISFEEATLQVISDINKNKDNTCCSYEFIYEY